MKEIDEVDVVNDIFDPEVQERFLKYTITPSSSNNCFYGNNYKIQDLTASSGVISVQRQGGFTTAILSMLLEEENGKPKYTIDQLFDPNQFQKEKQAKFDEVVKRSRNASDSGNKTMAESPDGKWIVETLYKGMKRLNDIIDETAEKIDFTNDDFIYSEEFAKIIGLSGITFDAWQEINRFDKMRHEVVLADKPELTTEASRRNHIDNLMNPLSSTYQKMRKVFESHNKVKDGNDITISAYISGTLHLKYVKDMMRDWKKSGKKLSQYLIDNNTNIKFDLHTEAANEAMRDMEIAFASGPNLQVVVDKRIQDGSLIKNIEYDEKNATFINFPQLNEDESDFDIEEMELDEASARKDLKSVKEIVASKDTWYPWVEKIRERFSKVHASLSPIADYYSDAIDLVIELVQLKSNPSKGIETIKKLVDFLHKKEGDKTLYETFAEGMKPGELYGLFDDIDKAFGGALDMDSIGKLSPMDKSAHEANKKAEEEPFKPGDEYTKRVFKYDFSHNHELKKSFFGKKYNTEMLRSNKKYNSGSISLDRTGGHSIAALNLLAMKDEDGNRIYSFDDVFNPKKFRKEKQEEFDKVVEHSGKAGVRRSGRKNKSSRWLVDNIYNSIKETVKIIDELAENIDFDDENFDKSEEYLQINLLGNIVFDAWQEICTFPELMDEKLKADYPKLNKQQRYDAFQDVLGPITSIGNEMITLADEHNRLKNHKTGAYMAISKYLYSAIKQKPAAEMFKEWHEKGKGKTLTQYFRDNKFGAKYHLMNFAANTAIEPMVKSCYETHHREKKLDNLFMTGELFKNVTYTPGKGKKEGVFHNVPTYDIKKEQVVFPEIKIDKKAAKKAGKKDKASNKTGKIIEENHIKEPVGKGGKTSGKAASMKTGPTIATRHGEDIPVSEVLSYLQALKQTAGEARGLFYDSPEYINFYMAIDDVTKAARDLKKNKNTNIINEDYDRLQNYKRAVDRLKDFAEDYENYKMADHTTDKTREPDKKALNSDDKRKLKIMKNVLHNNRYFNVDAPKLTNEEFLIKSERALARLKKDTYTSKRQYIEDSAYAMFGQMYRVNKDSGEPINLQEVMQEKIASGEFEKNLKSKKNPHGYISPKDVAKKAENKERMREMAAAIKKERTSINSNIIPDHPKRTTTKKEQTIKNPSKN